MWVVVLLLMCTTKNMGIGIGSFLTLDPSLRVDLYADQLIRE
jgi:hypothetical protein